MRMIAERLPLLLETHLCGFQSASSSWFTAYPVASTAWSDSDNTDLVDQDVCQVGSRHFWITCTDTEVLRLIKQNTDLACYCSRQSIEITIQDYIVDEGQVSDIHRHASRPARAFIC